MVKKRRIPPMLADIVQATFTSCDGALFDVCTTCPACGGLVSGYDVKRKQFAVLQQGDGKRVIHVLVKRYRCRQCGQVCFADQPFYPDTRIGSPVVDLCRTLADSMHFPRIASTLGEMGIIVDRWSVRNYVRNFRHEIPVADMFGVKIPLSIISLSSVVMETPEGGRIDTDRMLAACDYPSRKTRPGNSARSETDYELPGV